MRNYEGRLKALGKRIPPEEAGNFDIWINNGDGTLTDGERTITLEQFEREAANQGDQIITIGG